MIFIKNNQKKIKVDNKTLETKAKRMLTSLGYTDYDLSIWLTTNDTIKKYNKQYRKKNKATDILSFPYHDIKPGQKIIPRDPEDKNLGDIMISLEFVKIDAPNWNQSLPERLNTLLAHGIAHLLGHDHQTEYEYKAMQKLEKKFLKAQSLK